MLIFMIRVRFAPSPTGFLHIGNVRTALFNWLFARKHGGKFILRIEDTDIQRSRERYVNAIMEDLRWLGLDWDEGPDIGGEYGPYRQSHRKAIYEEYFKILKNKGLVYPCYCTPEELEKRRQLAGKRGEPPRYDNRCRNLTNVEKNRYENEGRKPSWRFMVSERIIKVKDIVRGEISFDTSLMGDFVILKQDRTPTFNFAVTVDDMCMKITHVIRGEDHLSNTPRHILLWEAFGVEPPIFAHNTLTLGPDGERLSKRHGAISIMEYRRMGYLPEGLLNYLVLLGWSCADKKELFNIKELVENFSLEGLSSAPAFFNKEKLDWVNRWHIRQMDIVRLTNLCIPYLRKAGLVKGPISNKRFEQLQKMVSTIKGNLTTLSDCTRYMRMYLTDTVEVPKGEYNPILFQTLYKMFSQMDDVKEIFTRAQEETGIKGKDFYMPIRLVLTGMSEGPELLDVIPLIGKEKILKRLCLYISTTH